MGGEIGKAALSQILEAQACCNETWEAAYSRFETPQEEICKFQRRLRKVGADRWPRDARIVDLMCGRGSNLHALSNAGFLNLEGLDLSPTLLDQYQGTAKISVCDCRDLPFEDRSKDILILQGGLHHLYAFPNDVHKTLFQAHRVLVEEGLMMIVEPWSTPFLTFAHFISSHRLPRRMWPKLESFETMYQQEKLTYDRWLGKADEVRDLLDIYFCPVIRTIAWGKLIFLGRKRQRSDPFRDLTSL